MNTETLDRLEAQASMRVGLEISTPVAVNPGELRELIACYRLHHGLAPITQKETTA
jgi:hypothetical protein